MDSLHLHLVPKIKDTPCATPNIVFEAEAGIKVSKNGLFKNERKEGKRWRGRPVGHSDVTYDAPRSICALGHNENLILVGLSLLLKPSRHFSLPALRQIGRLRVIVCRQIIAPSSEQLLHPFRVGRVVVVDRGGGPRLGYARSLRFSLEDFLTAPFLLSSFSTFSLWSSTFIMVSLASVTWSITSLQRCMLPCGQRIVTD